MDDRYLIPARDGEGKVTEKMSRFLSFAFHVHDAGEAREIIRRIQNEYHDARHVCWAYMVGTDGAEWQLNDNGEPSGTAGKPMLGQIRSRGLTETLVVAVRYFGGIKLGTPGLTAAYREAASLALDDAGSREVFRMEELRVTFPYVAADGVMKIVKGEGLEVVEKIFDNVCTLRLHCRRSALAVTAGRLAAVDGASVETVAAGV